MLECRRGFGRPRWRREIVLGARRRKSKISPQREVNEINIFVGFQND